MKPVRTYDVLVDGFGGVKYSARSPGKARARAHRDYCAGYQPVSFRQFLTISRVRRVADPVGCGERIVIGGETVTRVYSPPTGDGSVFYMKDGSDVVLCSHQMDVIDEPAVAALEGRPT